MIDAQPIEQCNEAPGIPHRGDDGWVVPVEAAARGESREQRRSALEPRAIHEARAAPRRRERSGGVEQRTRVEPHPPSPSHRHTTVARQRAGVAVPETVDHDDRAPPPRCRGRERPAGDGRDEKRQRASRHVGNISDVTTLSMPRDRALRVPKIGTSYGHESDATKEPRD